LRIRQGVFYLALAYAADQIVVMDAGRAVETGSHRALLAQDGFYRRLVATYEAGDSAQINDSEAGNPHSALHNPQ